MCSKSTDLNSEETLVALEAMLTSENVLEVLLKADAEYVLEARVDEAADPNPAVAASLEVSTFIAALAVFGALVGVSGLEAGVGAATAAGAIAGDLLRE